ncbi:hypothetical protein AtNW77_Chr4g0306741 [Arabidopsis thaliana]|uniref:Uncharacterized protein n=3 Tax=Arabidopsis TaxID=3701 RepID=B3H5I9_ARATH|nr:uncharacterized protein AT4G28775 [Arabidopsis thaliana]AEE85542.1 hypothetical protein AT4G28775 [Arabidopsis thaliana]|eukprot:NP_001119076.1 hypothetical protein AT4G28775 [Arabidopsis thaliana]
MCVCYIISIREININQKVMDNKTSLWKIRKILTEKSDGWLDFDNNNDIENHILRSLGESIISRVKKDSIKIKIDDYDTGSQHEVTFGYNHESDTYYIGSLWRLKELAAGDEIGLFYDPISKNLCFSVLKQAKSCLIKK